MAIQPPPCWRLRQPARQLGGSRRGAASQRAGRTKPAPARPPAAAAQVWVLEASAEVFRDYAAFVKKAELYKKPAWSCKYTGRGGLTFAEAVEEERRALAALAKVRAFGGGSVWERCGRRPCRCVRTLSATGAMVPRLCGAWKGPCRSGCASQVQAPGARGFKHASGRHPVNTAGALQLARKVAALPSRHPHRPPLHLPCVQFPAELEERVLRGIHHSTLAVEPLVTQLYESLRPARPAEEAGAATPAAEAAATPAAEGAAAGEAAEGPVAPEAAGDAAASGKPTPEGAAAQQAQQVAGDKSKKPKAPKAPVARGLLKTFLLEHAEQQVGASGGEGRGPRVVNEGTGGGACVCV